LTSAETAKTKFEDNIPEIEREIAKRRSKWNLTALAWMDFDDVSQIIRIHIHKKWHMYDHIRPLSHWINIIITNQIRNLIRNNYSNFARPCLRCAAFEGDDLCSIYSKQCSQCPLYANWEKTRKAAHDTKLPVTLENHTQEVYSQHTDNFDLEASSKNLHEKMSKVLKPIEWRVYKLLYVENKTDADVAAAMGYKTTEKNRLPGYKRIKNIKTTIITAVKKVLFTQDFDIV
jgi:DNA-directed RNA polymerase specialized sigma24 family protein